MYRAAGIPFVIGSDDPGILRGSLSGALGRLAVGAALRCRRAAPRCRMPQPTTHAAHWCPLPNRPQRST